MPPNKNIPTLTQSQKEAQARQQLDKILADIQSQQGQRQQQPFQGYRQGAPQRNEFVDQGGVLPAIGEAFSPLKEPLLGTPGKYEQYQTVTPEQQAFMNKILELVGPGIEKELQYVQEQRSKSPFEQLLGSQASGPLGNILGGLVGTEASSLLSGGGNIGGDLLSSLLGSLGGQAAQSAAPRFKEFGGSVLQSLGNLLGR